MSAKSRKQVDDVPFFTFATSLSLFLFFFFRSFGLIVRWDKVSTETFENKCEVIFKRLMTINE